MVGVWRERERERIRKISSLPASRIYPVWGMPFLCFSSKCVKQQAVLCLQIKQGSITNTVGTPELSLCRRPWSAAYCTHSSIACCHLSGCPVCALPCATHLSLFAVPSRALPRWNCTLTFAKMLCCRLLFSNSLFPHVEISLPCCPQHLRTAVPELFICCCCCYRNRFPVRLCKSAVLLRRQLTQSAPAVVCPGHFVQACTYFIILTSVMALPPLSVNHVAWISLLLPRSCLVVSLCYSTTRSPKAACR